MNNGVLAHAGRVAPRAVTTGRIPFVAAAVAVALTGAPVVHADIEEVVVTARKREESAQNIPVVVSAISEVQIERRGINSIETIAEATPQFVVARGTTGNGANLNIRGIGSNLTSIGIEQSVSINVDGVYQGQGRVLNEGMFDLKQVEILKGPQALFFGKNATAGALSLTTADPGDELEAMARAGYEKNAEEYRVEGFVSGPVSEQLGLRLALRYSDMSGGLVRNQGFAQTMNVRDFAQGLAVSQFAVPEPAHDTPGTEQISGRLTALFQPNDALSIKLKAAYNKSESNSGSWANELWYCPFGTSQLYPGAECKGDFRNYNQDLPAALVAENPLMNRHGGRLYEDSKSKHVTAIVHYDMPAAAIDWVSGWQDFSTQLLVKSDTTPFMNRGTFAATDTGYEAMSTELRLQTKFESPFNLMAGLYYQKSDLDFQQDIIFPGNAAGGPIINTAAADPTTRIIGVRKIGATDGRTFAAFGQVIWKFAPQWELTAGGRYTHEQKDSDYTQPWVNDPLRAAFRMFDPANPLSAFAHEQKWNDFSPEAMLSWKPADDVLVFAGYKTGYKSGGFSISGLNSAGTSLGDLAFEPEEAEGFEGGIKAMLLDRQLRLGASVYHYKYKDLQVDFFNSAITSYVTFNAGSAKTRGIEFDAEWAPDAVAGLVMRGTLSYGDAEYSSFPGAPCFAGQTPAQGCVAATAAIPYIHQDLEGVDTALAPSWTGSLGFDYDRVIGSFRYGISGSAKFSDEYLISPFGNPVDRQDSYVSLDAALRFGDEAGRWEVALIGKNLTNEYILTYGQDAPSTGAGTGTAAGVSADQFGFALPKRTIAVQFTYRH